MSEIVEFFVSIYQGLVISFTSQRFCFYEFFDHSESNLWLVHRDHMTGVEDFSEDQISELFCVTSKCTVLKLPVEER